jgi:putative Mn2+ efflux pump MntP
MFVYALGLALALAMDCFSVALGLACGLRGLNSRQSLRLAAFFGGFQFMMPVLGWLAGEKLVRLIGSFDHWVAFGLLALVGGKMIFEAFRLDEQAKAGRPDQTKGWPLLILSVATSIDALAVGLSLSLIGLPVVRSALVIGAGSFAMTIAGARLGPVVGRAAGRWAEVLGGAVLIGIGVRILLGHL